MVCAPSEDSDQPGHPPSLIRVFTVRIKKLGSLATHWAHSKDPLSVIWAFAGHTCHFVGFVMGWLISYFLIFFLIRHVANGEILGVALLMDDVLQTGVQDISVLTDRPAGDGDRKGDKKDKKGKPMAERRASSSAGSSKLGIYFCACD